MGLNFKYMLYFEKKYIWDALLGLVQISEQGGPPSIIHFPDHDLHIPFFTTDCESVEFDHTVEQLCFAISIYFDIDQEIIDYISWGGLIEEIRTPPAGKVKSQVPIGYIDLVVHQVNPYASTPELALFQFFTTGTHMSLLFENSISIRNTFSRLLENYHGVCGILELELSGGDLFWYHGKRMNRIISNAYLPPAQIKFD